MRRVALVLVLASVLVSGVGALAACESPRARSCRALLDAADDADAARAYTPKTVSSGVSPLALGASRNQSVARLLRTMDKPDPDLREAADALASAMDRRGATYRRIDDAIKKIHFAPAATDAGLSMSTDPISELMPHVSVLANRCAAALLPTRTGAAAPPECESLLIVAKTCASPAPEASVETHLVHCTAELSSVRSDDPATKAAIHAVVRAFESFRPAAARIETPAVEIVAALEEVQHVDSERRMADRDADEAATRLRKACGAR